MPEWLQGATANGGFGHGVKKGRFRYKQKRGGGVDGS